MIIVTEKLYLYYIHNLKRLNFPNINTNTFSLGSKILQELNLENISILERPHKIVLITLITNRFLSICLKSHGKLYS